VYREVAHRIPDAERAAKGTIIYALLPLEQDERITAIINVESFHVPEADSAYFVMVTRQGRVKRVQMNEFEAVRSSGMIAISLNDDDTLAWVKRTNGDQDVVIVTEQGQSIRFHESEVRVMGRGAAGVNAIRLADDDRPAGMDAIDPANHTHILVITRNGYGKRTPIEEYRRQGRFGGGIRTLARNEKTGPIIGMRCINSSDEILLITRDAVVLRTRLDEIRDTGRNTQGVRVMNVADDDEVVGMTIVRQEPEILEAATNPGVDGGAPAELPAQPSA
jgi:DNA gyrase subunit A